MTIVRILGTRNGGRHEESSGRRSDTNDFLISVITECYNCWKVTNFLEGRWLLFKTVDLNFSDLINECSFLRGNSMRLSCLTSAV